MTDEEYKKDHPQAPLHYRKALYYLGFFRGKPTQAEVRTAYKRLCLKLHPDKRKDKDKNDPYLDNWMKNVTKSYEELQEYFKECF